MLSHVFRFEFPPPIPTAFGAYGALCPGWKVDPEGSSADPGTVEMGRPAPTGLPSISAVVGLDRRNFWSLPSFAAAPPAKLGESGLSASNSEVPLYGFALLLRRLRSIQNRIPIKARARGIPTAHPTMTPMLLDLPPELDGLALLLLAPALGSDVGVTTEVMKMVATPAEPEETLALTEVKGVGVAETESAVALGAREPAEDCAFEAVCEAEPPLPDPLPSAKPVMPEMVGTEEAVFEPMVAYAFPS